MEFLREQLEKVKASFERIVRSLEDVEKPLTILDNECAGDCESCIANRVCMDFLNRIFNFKVCIVERLLWEWTEGVKVKGEE